MTAPLAFIPDIAEEHLEELAFLWGQRRVALRSPAYAQRAMAQLEERIAAHADGLVVLGAHLPAFVASALAGEEELPAFAAAYALLRLGGDDARACVMDAFRSAEGKRLAGVAEALKHGAPQELAEALVELAKGDGQRGALASEILAFRGMGAPSVERVAYLAGDDAPAVRASAWRAASYAGLALPTAQYDAGLRDGDPAVRAAALEAALWAQHPNFLPYCRALAERPTKEMIDALVLYAAVAGAEELPRLGTVLRDRSCGPARLRVAGAFGHPALIEPLITLMGGDDAATAAAAGAAFEKIAGGSIESGTRGTVAPEGSAPDAFDAEFLDEVMLPDAAKARAAWQALVPRVSGATRICRGHDVSRGADRTAFASLDMESRWELCARARLAGQWRGTPAVLEAFPLRS